MTFICLQNNKQRSVCPNVMHHFCTLATHLIPFFLSLIKSEIPNYPGSSQHRGAQYCPEWQESFVCVQETERASGAAGTMERAEARPITGDEFCALGNLLKTQNCQSAAHISMRLMTHGFSFKMPPSNTHSELVPTAGEVGLIFRNVNNNNEWYWG